MNHNVEKFFKMYKQLSKSSADGIMAKRVKRYSKMKLQDEILGKIDFTQISIEDFYEVLKSVEKESKQFLCDFSPYSFNEAEYEDDVCIYGLKIIFPKSQEIFYLNDYVGEYNRSNKRTLAHFNFFSTDEVIKKVTKILFFEKNYKEESELFRELFTNYLCEKYL